MFRHNLTVYGYCFIVFVLDDSSCLLTSSCTLHSRKFPTKPSVHICSAVFVASYRFHLFSISFLLVLFVFATWFSWSCAIVQLPPSRFYPIISKTISTCTGYFSVISTALKSAQTNTLDFKYLWTY